MKSCSEQSSKSGRGGTGQSERRRGRQERIEENRSEKIKPKREIEAGGVGDRCHCLRSVVLEELTRIDGWVVERSDERFEQPQSRILSPQADSKMAFSIWHFTSPTASPHP